jgi:hypothetical protein
VQRVVSKSAMKRRLGLSFFIILYTMYRIEHVVKMVGKEDAKSFTPNIK